MQRLLFALATLLVCAPLIVSRGAGEKPPQTEQVRRGAALYDVRCAVCHGDTGLGLEEARLAFPEDHRRCERCHKPNNPSQMTPEQMNPRNAFSVGDPPTLYKRDLGFSDAWALHRYIQVAMPRPFPGSLSAEESLAVTAYVLELRGVLPPGVTLNEENAATFSLR